MGALQGPLDLKKKATDCDPAPPLLLEIGTVPSPVFRVQGFRVEDSGCCPAGC